MAYEIQQNNAGRWCVSEEDGAFMPSDSPDHESYKTLVEARFAVILHILQDVLFLEESGELDYLRGLAERDGNEILCAKITRLKDRLEVMNAVFDLP